MSEPLNKSDVKQLSRSDIKRMAIIEAATVTFIEEGYGAASMDEIARRADVSKRTVYNHFCSKDALFSAIIQSECDQVLEAVHERMANEGPLREVLLQFGIDFLCFIFSPHGVKMYRSIVSEAERFPELGAVFFEAGCCPAQIKLRDYLACQIRKGHLMEEDLDFLASQFFSMITGDQHHRLLLAVDKGYTRDEITYQVTKAVDAWLRAFGTAG